MVNIKSNTWLIKELCQNRLQKPNRPGGYTKGDIKRFRKLFNLSADVPVIVGHTPITLDNTLWSNVGDIENHFVVYGGYDQWIGVMARLGDNMFPLTYPVEPLLDYINSLTE